MAFYISTTGSQDPVVIDDFGERSFDHPTVDLDLELEYTYDEIVASNDLQAAIDAGYLTAKDTNGNNIINIKETARLTHFTQLDDTPTTYSGSGDQYVAITPVEDGLEFTTVSGFAPTAHTHVLVDVTDSGDAAARNTGTVSGNVVKVGPGGLTGDEVMVTNSAGNAETDPINTAFNKNFGTVSGTVSEGNHSHNLYTIKHTL